MAEVAGWIWQHNLRSLLELLSHYVGYDFDGTDWDTAELELRTDTLLAAFAQG
ncbi:MULTISPECIES: hypothetical protein [Streptomyces]|uniref:CdiI immunity protein domain-containing protein n=1 Tax=Streptomyces virginiae TaxID=1961 RepID=A0ABZ1T5S1_STRVG|nr:hypothetical protein [Streptomyces virginiae]WTB20486.1 hypothetical protein OG253_02715 [Streptomyces virginiae]